MYQIPLDLYLASMGTFPHSTIRNNRKYNKHEQWVLVTKKWTECCPRFKTSELIGVQNIRTSEIVQDLIYIVEKIVTTFEVYYECKDAYFHFSLYCSLWYEFDSK